MKRKYFLSCVVLFLISMVSVSGFAQDIAPVSATVPETEQADDDDVLDADDEKLTVDKINEVIQKIYDRIITAKEKYKELAGFNESCLTKSESGFLSLHYETQIPSSRGETYPFIFKLDVEPLKSNRALIAQQPGYFEYPLPMLDLQFSALAIKHPLRRQFDFKSLLEERAEELVDYQQQFMPLKFMIVFEEKVFKVNQPIFFKVVLMNVSQHNILVNSLGKETLFFTLNDSAWGTRSGEASALPTLTPRQQRRQDSIKRAEMRRLARQQKNNVGGQTIMGRRTHVGDQIILHEGEALVIDFQGEGYRRAQDVDIRGIYQLNVKGLRPTAKVKIKIID